MEESSGKRGSASVSFDEIAQQPTPHRDDGDRAKRRKVRRRAGMLRGLERDNMLSPPAIQATIETSNNDGGGQDRPPGMKHVTRQSRHGRSVETKRYDMKLRQSKFHPMDEVTRPKRTAKRMGQSLSPVNDSETEEESLPSSAVRSDSGLQSDSRSDEEGEKTLIDRQPDPRATRHSSRTAAHKLVNYNRKHHPQDFALPGHQRKARTLKDQMRRAGSTRARTQADDDSDDDEDNQPWISEPNVSVRELDAVEIVRGGPGVPRIRINSGISTAGRMEERSSRASTEIDEDPFGDLERIDAMHSSPLDIDSQQGRDTVLSSDGDRVEEFRAVMDAHILRRTQTDTLTDIPSTDPVGPLEEDGRNVDEDGPPGLQLSQVDGSNDSFQ